MSRSILIARNGAYGDIIHMTHLPRLLKDNGYTDVGVATGWKGKQLLDDNPFIDRVHMFEPGGREIRKSYFEGRFRVLRENYDDFIDLHNTLEVGALAMECQDEYYQHQKIRTRIGQRNYYDISTCVAGYPQLCGKYRGEVFYPDEEIKIVEHDLLRPGRFKDNFKVMINLAGSSPHKFFIQRREVAQYILGKYPDAVIFTTGDKTMDIIDIKDLGERVRSLVGRKPFRQALLMAKYMNCVIGCESGIMCGASMWDVPTIQLLTATDKNAHCKYSKHDYSLQSPARCSPCYKGPYKYYGCPKKDNSPLCIFFNIEDIKNQIDKIYATEYTSYKVS